MRDAAFDGFDRNFIAELKNLDVFRLHERLERGEVNCAGAGRGVVLRRKLHVMDVKAGKSVGERFEMRRVLDEAEVFLDLRVAGVVPINNVGAGKFAEEKLEIGVERNFLERLPVFAAEFETEFFGFGQDFSQRVVGALDEFFLFGFKAGGGLGAEFLEFGGIFPAAFEHFAKFAGVILQVHAAEMQHDERRLDARGEFKRLERVTDGEFAFARFLGGKFIQVRRRMCDAHRQRAKIVQAGNFHFARVHGFKNSGHEADTGAVAQLRVAETEVADFAQHRASVRVTAGIPAS